MKILLSLLWLALLLDEFANVHACFLLFSMFYQLMVIGSHGKSGNPVMCRVAGAFRLGKGTVLNLFMEVRHVLVPVMKPETATPIPVQVGYLFYTGGTCLDE